MKITIDPRIQGLRDVKCVSEHTLNRFFGVANFISGTLSGTLLNSMEIIKISFHSDGGQKTYVHFNIVMKFFFPESAKSKETDIKPEQIEIKSEVSLKISEDLNVMYRTSGKFTHSDILLKSRAKEDIAQGLIQAMSEEIQQRSDSISEKAKFLEEMKKITDSFVSV